MRGSGGWKPWRFKSGEHFKIWEGEAGKLLKRDFMQLGLTTIHRHIQTAGTSVMQAAWQYKGALCSDPHSGPLVCYSCIWYCTSGMGWESRCNYWKKAQGVDGRLLSNETEGCLSKPLNKASSTTPPSSSTGPRSLSSGEHSFHFKMSRPKLHITSNCT